MPSSMQAAARPLPLPPGYSEATILDLLLKVRPANAPVREMESYRRGDYRRFLYTLDLATNLSGPALELGANPYFMTTLLRHFTACRVTCANYFSSSCLPLTSQMVHFLAGEESVPYYHFNVETERFPFDDGTFDAVFFCEILEHLQVHPVGCLREIKRVLRPGGRLVLTTPNVARRENVARMLRGQNLYDPDSGYGTYGRHNREYTEAEVRSLLDWCGFAVEESFTADVHEGALELKELDDLLAAWHRKDLGQYIFTRSINSGSARERRPAWLYRSYPEEELDA